MWRLHRYYLRELAVNASVTFLVLFAIALVSFIYRGIQRAAGGTLTDALVITVLFALDSMQHLLTISFLLATVMTYTRAAQDRELVAIRAAGISSGSCQRSGRKVQSKWVSACSIAGSSRSSRSSCAAT